MHHEEARQSFEEVLGPPDPDLTLTKLRVMGLGEIEVCTESCDDGSSHELLTFSTSAVQVWWDALPVEVQEILIDRADESGLLVLPPLIIGRG